MQYEFDWDENKNELLKATRGISFEKIVEAIKNNKLLRVSNNPSRNHSNQEIFFVNINNYIYSVPFVRKEISSNKIFLKTIYANRKYTKIYLKNK
jgi:uncharacterized DUF497 family protein